MQMEFGGTSIQNHGDSHQINKLAKDPAIHLMGTHHKEMTFSAGTWEVL